MAAHGKKTHAHGVHSVVFDQQQRPPAGSDALQFYTGTYSHAPGGAYGMAGVPRVSWVAALGTGDAPDEPSLLEELGINLDHIRAKTVSVLNPLRTIDKHMMDDTDLAGPLLFCLLFGLALLLSGKVHFGYIYGLALLGWASIYVVLNLISEQGIDTWLTASVLGYCLLPMVLLSALSVLLPLQ